MPRVRLMPFHEDTAESSSLRLLSRAESDGPFDAPTIATTPRGLSAVKSSFRLFLIFGTLLFASIILFLGVFKDRVGVLTLVPGPESQISSQRDETIYLNSTPTMFFRGHQISSSLSYGDNADVQIENLVDGVSYVTAWPIEGFTNQFIAQINLIYLSGLANRIPILPSFLPAHMKGKPNPGPLAFSQIFDLPKLASELRRPILEWKDVKNTSSREVEDIGCWSLFGTLFGREPHFDHERQLALDVSLTRVPNSSRFSPTTMNLNLVSLASLGWHDTRMNVLTHTDPSPSPQHKHTAPPDEQMLCYDNLYYGMTMCVANTDTMTKLETVGTVGDFEWDAAWGPSWNLVGKYANYNPSVEQLARQYVLRAFGMSSGETFPWYISVHVRRTDFAGWCGGRPAEHCFPPLTAYAALVDEVKAEILATRGISVDKILLTSDEVNQTWWDDVHGLGWKSVDHEAERTEEIHGAWYPVLLDTVALSLARGFVGTTASTLSLLASKRVQLWENGPVRRVGLGNY